MKKYLFSLLLLPACLWLQAQRVPSQSVLKSWPISVTPLSFWDSDISASAGVEYHFHPCFSTRLAADYIYADYSYEHSTTSGFRIREEFRYYIAGGKFINRSKVWPYLSVAFGNKWVKTNFSNWHYIYENGEGYERWQTYITHNNEWHMLGRMGMQTAFGNRQRFFFDISLGLGLSHNRVSYSYPDMPMATDDINGFELNSSANKYSGNFTAFNFEACFGYRLFSK